MRTALELDLFNLLGESTTASELANRTGADETLIGVPVSVAKTSPASLTNPEFAVRMMRVLTGFNIVSEIEEHKYAHTPLSRALTMPATADLNKHT